jgi:hypothetical protein
LFTSASALLAIISQQLSVADNLKDHAASAAELSILIINIGTLIVRMKINTAFAVAEFEKELLAFRAEYRKQSSKLKYDLLLTERLRKQIQVKLNASFPKEQNEPDKLRPHHPIRNFAMHSNDRQRDKYVPPMPLPPMPARPK